MMLRKLKAFIQMDRNMKLMLIEAYGYLAWARILKKLPFAKIAPSLGEHMGETTHSLHSGDRPVLYSVSQAVHIMSKYTLWESQCLVKAIAAMKMLERRHVETTLYLGTGRDEHGKLVAHAWLRSGPYYVTGSEGMEKFTVVSKFAMKISKEKVDGAGYEKYS